MAPDGLVCLLLCSICVVHGSHGAHACTLLRAFMAYDTCSRYSGTARFALPPDYQEYIIPNVPSPPLAGAMRDLLQLFGLVKLLVRHPNTFSFQPLVTTERLAVLLVPETAFADEHSRVHHVQAGKIVLFKSGRVRVAGMLSQKIPTDTSANKTRVIRNTAPTIPSDGVYPSSLCIIKVIRVPAMTQMTMRVPSNAID